MVVVIPGSEHNADIISALHSVLQANVHQTECYSPTKENERQM